MPPRYAYWTIIVDNAPTAFRSGSKEELLPTFNRLKEKHESAVMKWWQNGKLWDSRLDAQEAMRARGELGRRNDSRQADRPSFRDRSPARRSFSEGGSFRDQSSFVDRRSGTGDEKPARAQWSAGTGRKPSEPARDESGKLGWKPKGEFTPAPKRERTEWDSKPRAATRKPFEKPAWKPRSSEKPEWRAKSQKSDAEGGGPRRSATREGGPEWKPKGEFTPSEKRQRKPQWGRKPQAAGAAAPKRDSATAGRKPEWKPRSESKPEWRPKSQAQSRKPSDRPKLDWTPKSGYTDKADRPATEKRKWVPKAEYKKSLGIEAKRDSKWRPGGEHRDPKQKYKDAKKAKWTQFKQTIRKRWEAKGGKKRRDEDS